MGVTVRMLEDGDRGGCFLGGIKVDTHAHTRTRTHATHKPERGRRKWEGDGGGYRGRDGGREGRGYTRRAP